MNFTVQVNRLEGKNIANLEVWSLQDGRVPVNIHLLDKMVKEHFSNK